MKAVTTGSGWRVVGASVQGESHRRTGQVCQDSHGWQEVAEGVLVVSVADGAGSAACSEIGSALAAQSAVHDATQRLHCEIPDSDADWRLLLRNVFQVARHGLEAQAAELEFSPLDLATTLLLVIATRHWLAAGQVGDGAVVGRLKDDSFRAFTQPNTQEYINETTFLTSPTYLDNVQYVVHKGPVTGLALFTDGLQMLALKMPQAAPHTAFFAPLLHLLAEAPERDKAEAQLRGFLQSPRITQRADDDLTLVLAVRDEGGKR